MRLRVFFDQKFKKAVTFKKLKKPLAAACTIVRYRGACQIALYVLVGICPIPHFSPENKIMEGPRGHLLDTRDMTFPRFLAKCGTPENKKT